MEVGDLMIMAGVDVDGWWVGKVLQLLDVIWDENHPDDTHGDVVVHEFDGVGLNATFKPLYQKGRKAVQMHCWMESCVVWGAQNKMLTKKGRITAIARKSLPTETI